MARIVSFATLLILMLFFVGLMFHILADFLVPLFLALVLAVVFDPTYRWLDTKLRGHQSDRGRTYDRGDSGGRADSDRVGRSPGKPGIGPTVSVNRIDRFRAR